MCSYLSAPTSFVNCFSLDAVFWHNNDCFSWSTFFAPFVTYFNYLPFSRKNIKNQATLIRPRQFDTLVFTTFREILINCTSCSIAVTNGWRNKKEMEPLSVGMSLKRKQNTKVF